MRQETLAMGTTRAKTSTNRRLVYLVIAVAVLVVVGANAHLLYAALDSQPDCVSHLKVGHGQAGAFGAAESAC